MTDMKQISRIRDGEREGTALIRLAKLSVSQKCKRWIQSSNSCQATIYLAGLKQSANDDMVEEAGWQ